MLLSWDDVCVQFCYNLRGLLLHFKRGDHAAVIVYGVLLYVKNMCQCVAYSASCGKATERSKHFVIHAFPVIS